MAVFDANFLVYWLDADATPPEAPRTQLPISDLKKRVASAITQIRLAGDELVIPTPVLSEYLVGADNAGAARLAAIKSHTWTRIADFDEHAAVELAALNRTAIAGGNKRAGVSEPWQKVKLDRQIVAIAKMEKQEVIYSEDEGLRKFAELAGIKAYSLADL